MKKLSISLFAILGIAFALATAFTTAPKKASFAITDGYNLYQATSSIDDSNVPSDESDASTFWSTYGDPGVAQLNRIAYDASVLIDPRVRETEPESGVTFAEEFCEDAVDGDLCLITLYKTSVALTVKEIVFGPKQ